MLICYIYARFKTTNVLFNILMYSKVQAISKYVFYKLRKVLLSLISNSMFYVLPVSISLHVQTDSLHNYPGHLK